MVRVHLTTGLHCPPLVWSSEQTLPHTAGVDCTGEGRSPLQTFLSERKVLGWDLRYLFSSQKSPSSWERPTPREPECCCIWLGVYAFSCVKSLFFLTSGLFSFIMALKSKIVREKKSNDCTVVRSFITKTFMLLFFPLSF